MDHHARGQGAVLALVDGQSVRQQAAGVSGEKVRLAVLAADVRSSSTDDHSLATLVEDVRDSGLEGVRVRGAVERDTDVAGLQVGGCALQPPGDPAGLVVQRYVQVPRAGCLVLSAALGRGWRGLVPCAGPQDLQGDPEPEGAGLEQVMEVGGERCWAVVLCLPVQGPGVVLRSLVGEVNVVKCVDLKRNDPNFRRDLKASVERAQRLLAAMDTGAGRIALRPRRAVTRERRTPDSKLPVAGR